MTQYCHLLLLILTTDNIICYWPYGVMDRNHWHYTGEICFIFPVLFLWEMELVIKSGYILCFSCQQMLFVPVQIITSSTFLPIKINGIFGTILQTNSRIDMFVSKNYPALCLGLSVSQSQPLFDSTQSQESKSEVSLRNGTRQCALGPILRHTLYLWCLGSNLHVWDHAH